MMDLDILIYIFALIINIFVAVWVLRKYSIFSCQGLLIIFTFSYLLSDAAGLGLVALFNLPITPLPLEEEIFLRAYPTFLHAMGFFLFALGLAIAFPRPLNQTKINIERKDLLKYLKGYGTFFVVLGLSMYFASWATEGIYTLSTFYKEMYKYSYETKRFEFLTYGQHLVFIGFSLLAISYRKHVWQFMMLVFAGIFGILLTSGKSGLFFALICFYVALYIFQCRSFRYWFRPTILFILLCFSLVGIGIKTQVKYREPGQQLELDVKPITNLAFSVVGVRWGPTGLYRGYSTLVERLREYSYWYAQGKVSYFALVASIPRFLWSEKPLHPTKGLGYLTSPYGRIDPYAAEAPMLVGTWIWDLGLLGLLWGMLFFGLLIGLISRYFARENRFIKYAPAYLFFVVSGVSFAESGFINFLPTLVIVVVIMIICLMWMIIRITIKELFIKKNNQNVKILPPEISSVNTIYKTKNSPLVSVIIPCRNEEKFIGKCLNSLLLQDYPKEKMEILVIDGMSEDGTRKIIERYAQKYPYIKLLDNSKKIIPSAMNIGIKNAKGEIIMKMDAHAIYKRDYVLKCVKYLNLYNTDNIGGIYKIIPRENTLKSKAITFVLSHPFGSGNAYIKIGCNGPRWADSVSFGCFKKEIFKKIGLFNEKLVRGSDMDFNKRIKKAGGKILLVPNIVTYYYADANFKSFWKHNFSDGIWTTHVLKFGSRAFSIRHWIPLFFVLSLIISVLLLFVFFPFPWLFLLIIGIYYLANITACVNIMIHMEEKNIKYLFLLPITFLIRHTAHGMGAFLGLIIPKIEQGHKEEKPGSNYSRP